MSQATTQTPMLAQRAASVNLTIDGAIDSYRRHLRAENKSAATVETYLRAVAQLQHPVGDRPLRQVRREERRR